MSAARKAGYTPLSTKPDAGPAVTVKHDRTVKLVRAMKVEVVLVDLGGGRREFRRKDDVAATPGTPPAKRGAGAGHHREPGSDKHQPRQQDLFLTCGDPAGTLPCSCPFDRAHENRHGGRFVAAAVDGPGAPGTGGSRPRSDSVARRYPAAVLDGAGQSIDAQMDAQCEREMWLAKLGVKGYGRVDDGSSGYRAADLLFSGRDKDQVRTMLRWNGMSNTLGPINGRGKNI